MGEHSSSSTAHNESSRGAHAATGPFQAVSESSIEENRPTLEQMALYAYQQGIAHRQFKPEEIFPEGMMTKVVI